MTNRFIAFTKALILVLLAVAVTVGQESSVTQPRANIRLDKSVELSLPSDPITDGLITTEMIMMHARELKLSPIQWAFILKEVRSTSVEFDVLLRQLDEAVEVFRDMINAQSVDEDRALMQLNSVLDTERKLKILQMRMSIRIKNQLTPDQMRKLQSIRNSHSIRSSTGLFVRPKWTPPHVLERAFQPGLRVSQARV